MLHEAASESLAFVLQTHGLADPAPLLVTSTDLDFQGGFARQWLVVTPTAVAVVAEGPPGQLLRTVDPNVVEQYRTTSGVGSGLLQARVGDGWVDLVRYSNSLAHRYHKVAAKLEQFRKDGELVLQPGEGTDERRCSKCKLALAFAGDVCPRCIDRGAVIGRLWALARPYRWAAVAMSLLVLLGVVVELAPPKLQQYLVDHVLRVDDGGPASCPEEFISLRTSDADGHDHEVGLVRDLRDWPAQKRALVEAALARRWFLRTITAVESIRLEYGLLTFQVRTDRGPATFTMRNSHSSAPDYGPRGKLLIDVDDNRYVVADVAALPRRQQALFHRYIYW